MWIKKTFFLTPPLPLDGEGDNGEDGYIGESLSHHLPHVTQHLGQGQSGTHNL